MLHQACQTCSPSDAGKGSGAQHRRQRLEPWRQVPSPGAGGEGRGARLGGGPRWEPTRACSPTCVPRAPVSPHPHPPLPPRGRTTSHTRDLRKPGEKCFPPCNTPGKREMWALRGRKGSSLTFLLSVEPRGCKGSGAGGRCCVLLHHLGRQLEDSRGNIGEEQGQRRQGRRGEHSPKGVRLQTQGMWPGIGVT